MEVVILFIAIILFFLILLIMYKSLIVFINRKYDIKLKRRLSWYGLVSLALLYITIALGFSGIYLLLEILGVKVLYSYGALPLKSTFDYILNVVYFSMTTLFSIGYGEWVPIGLGKLVAVIEGLIGYLLPPAFIISYISPFSDKKI